MFDFFRIIIMTVNSVDVFSAWFGLWGVLAAGLECVITLTPEVIPELAHIYSLPISVCRNV